MSTEHMFKVLADFFSQGIGMTHILLDTRRPSTYYQTNHKFLLFQSCHDVKPMFLFIMQPTELVQGLFSLSYNRTLY